MKYIDLFRMPLMLLIASGVFNLPASTALAEVITPTIATGTAATFGSPTLLINGAGLSGVGPILTQTHQTIHTQGWLKDNTNPANELVFQWTGGETADLTGVYIWQYDQGCCPGRGVNTFDILFSTDNGASFPVSIPLSLNSAVPGDESVQSLTFAPQAGVTDVKFTNMTDFPSEANPGWQGLNEVRFEGTVNVQPPFVPPVGSIPVGNSLTSRVSATDGATTVFYTNYEPMPVDGTVDSVGIYFQGQGAENTFEVHQLRPTGNPDEYDVVYSSGTVVPFGAAGQIENFPFANGPTNVLAGDIFAHYGRGIPFSDGGADANPIFFPIEAASAPQVGDVLTLSNTVGASSRGPFPIRTDLPRNYAMAVNFEPGGELPPDPAETVIHGQAVVDRASTDTFFGSIIHDNPIEDGSGDSDVAGQVTSWRFFNNNAEADGRLITPLLIERIGGDNVVRGIGATRTVSADGEQQYAFDLAQGTDTFDWSLGTFRMGVRYGSPDVANPGVVDFDNAGGSWTFIGDGAGAPPIVLGAAVSGAQSFAALGRDYSVQFTVEPVPEPTSLLLLLCGAMCGVMGYRRRSRM